MVGSQPKKIESFSKFTWCITEYNRVFRTHEIIEKLAYIIRFNHFLPFLTHTLSFVDAAPLQSLPQKPGYVPVYIRYGDTPLEEINAGLAVAFREFGGEARNIREDDKDQMLADEPAPESTYSESVESKEEEAKSTKAPVAENKSDESTGDMVESKSVENDTKEQEVPHALPVKEATKQNNI